MRRLRSLSGDDMGSEFAWRDTVMNALLVVLMVLMIIITQVSEEKKLKEAEVSSPGNVVVEITWDSDRNVDLDLWVKAPKDRPVGFRRLPSP